MLREGSWSRSNSFWGTSQFKPPNGTSGASNGFDQPSMITLVSSRILELGDGCGRLADQQFPRRRHVWGTVTIRAVQGLQLKSSSQMLTSNPPGTPAAMQGWRVIP